MTLLRTPRIPTQARDADGQARVAIVALGIALVVAPVLVWTLSSHRTEFGGAALVLRDVGVVTGFVASMLMVEQVLLIARIPWIERVWGHDVLARTHRQLGYWSFWLMVLHIMAFTGEHLARDAGPVGHVLAELYLWRWEIFCAALGVVLIIAAVATSVRYAKRRMRYESWHLVHLYTYLGMAFALPHQIVTGPDFHDIAAKAYWSALWGAAVLAVLVYRVGVPLWRSRVHRLEVDSVTVERDRVVTVTMSGRHVDRLNARAGQFFLWRFRDGPGWMGANPYSLSARPTATSLRITAQACGDGSARLVALQRGTPVAIEGPYGTMTLDRRRHPHAVFLAAGLGIAPLRALVEDAGAAPGTTTLIYRCSTSAQQIFGDELESLASSAAIRIVYLPGRRRSDDSWLPEGHDGPDHVRLREIAPAIAESDVFVCGPTAWAAAATRAARRAGAPGRVHTEAFGW
jgi:predicted ferric reductase